MYMLALMSAACYVNTSALMAALGTCMSALVSALATNIYQHLRQHFHVYMSPLMSALDTCICQHLYQHFIRVYVSTYLSTWYVYMSPLMSALATCMHVDYREPNNNCNTINFVIRFNFGSILVGLPCILFLCYKK